MNTEPRTNTNELNPVLASARFISENSEDVFIPDNGVEKAAAVIRNLMQAKAYSTATWKSYPLQPKTADESTVDWIFLVDLLNFSFWSEHDDRNRYAVSLDGVRYTGYWTLCACVNRALREGIAITSPATWVSADATDEFFGNVFRADEGCKEGIPLIAERIDAMRQSGRVLCDKFGGSFVNCIRAAGGSALRLVELIVREFPSFRDERLFLGQKVQFFKRAQILVSDIWACFDKVSYGSFYDINQITAFADYRVPQALVHFGALQYSPSLLALLKSGAQILPGHRLETEIRGSTIWAVERIRQAVVRQEREEGSDCETVNAILLDFFIWDYAKDPANAREMEAIPIHCTRSVYY